jgi:hypothetical protein
MIKILGSFVLVFVATLAHAESVRILNSSVAQAAYVSAELDGQLPVWVMDSLLVSTEEAKAGILQGKIACTLWLMDFSDAKDHSKTEIVETIFPLNKEIPLWKRVNGKAIFVDEATSNALSYNCVAWDPERGHSDLDAIKDSEFNGIFAGLLEIRH